MTTTTPRPDDIPITDYTVDSKAVTIPLRFRVDAVLARLTTTVLTLLFYGRLVGHQIHRTASGLVHRLSRVGRVLFVLVPLPFRLVLRVVHLLKFAVQTLIGFLVLSLLLLVVITLVQSVFEDKLHHYLPRSMPRFPS